jgi:transposase
VVPRTKQNISAKKTMVTIFFRSTRLLVLNFLPKGTKFNQDYFIDTVLPNLYSEKRRIARRKGLQSFSVHMDNSMCHNGAKITEKLEKRHIARPPYPPYSPDLSPCDFWLFGILKQKMKERGFQSEEQILAAITENWNELTSKDIQRIFHNWMERLTWVIANSGEYYQS